MTDETRLTPEERALLEAQKKATQEDGAWEVAGSRYPIQSPQGDRIGMIAISVPHPKSPPNWEPIYVLDYAEEIAAYIVAAANAVPGLLDEIARLRGDVAGLRDVRIPAMQKHWGDALNDLAKCEAELDALREALAEELAQRRPRPCARFRGGDKVKYRKKPVVIEAWQYMPATVEHIRGVCRSSHNGTVWPSDHLHTAHEGQYVYLQNGDWIIPEPDGEHFYPCKPDIFAATYEPVRDFCDHEIGSEIGTILCDKEPFHEGPHRISNRVRSSASPTTETK